MTGNGRKELGRREMIRRAAVTAGTAVWAVPVIRTVAATPAYAQSQTSPVADHSACVAACNASADQAGRSECKRGGRCEGLCDLLCPKPTEGGLEGRPCINCASAANPSAFSFAPDCTVTACGQSA